ncbi:MAG: polysaccharide deacetylase family protein, partial [Clostridia bacterium]|nr:polysaccharide deacetylase family protein [Clostridia bacterium]
KATFFIGGCWADDNVDCLRAIYEAGHELGNHGYFHKDQDKLDLVNNQKEIAECNKFVELAVGVTPTLFAPPSGAYNANTLEAAKALGMKTILWSRDTIDWRDKNSSLIYTRATKNIKSGEFVLMHPMAATADALEDILKYYKSLSLAAVTVSENLREKG